MSTVNKVSLTGRVATDVKFDTTSNGKGRAWLKVAVKGKTDMFFPVTIWGKAAEYARDNVNKGDLVQIEGSLGTYRPQNAEKDVLEVSAFDIALLVKKAIRTVTDDTSVEDDPFADE